MHTFIRSLAVLMVISASTTTQATDISDRVTHGYAENDGVKIHYAEMGEGPLVVMIHGFPDFWYTWRHQMAGLADGYRVAAIDLRGYNLSDQPEGVASYAMPLLIGDIAEVIRHLGEDSATVVAHDWGGVIAWQFAYALPQMVDKLVILNLPHPNGLAQAWANSEEALEGADYARVFRAGSPQDPDIFFGMPMTAETISGWVKDPAAREEYIEAFQRSNFDGMLAYYKANYPDLWSPDYEPSPPLPPLEISTLMFHGLEDTALHSDALNNTWDWIGADLTLVTIPGAGHFVQQDAAEQVTNTLRLWLDQRAD